MAVWCSVSRTPPVCARPTTRSKAEIHCHGSSAVLQAVLSALFDLGARQAEPGEFTRRAFLNGKLDLFAAEAVGDLVTAHSEQAAALAVSQLGGHMSTEFADMRQRLIAVCAQFLAVIDYPDEEIEDLPLTEIGQTLSDMRARLTTLHESYSRGRALREGLPCAIIGRPNAGKSTLLNALLGYDRAIVTDIAGTTRDTIEETLCLGGLVLRLQDTAGLRETNDPVEKIGVSRARDAVRTAAESGVVLAVFDGGLRETNDPVEKIGVSRARDAVRTAAESGVVLAVFDGSKPVGGEDRMVMRESKNAARAVAILNKADLPRADGWEELSDCFRAVVPLSAKHREGLSELTDTLLTLTGVRDLPSDGGLITNIRQSETLKQTAERLELAAEHLKAGFSPDAVVYDIEGAIERVCPSSPTPCSPSPACAICPLMAV